VIIGVPSILYKTHRRKLALPLCTQSSSRPPISKTPWYDRMRNTGGSLHSCRLSNRIKLLKRNIIKHQTNRILLLITMYRLPTSAILPRPYEARRILHGRIPQIHICTRAIAGRGIHKQNQDSIRVLVHKDLLKHKTWYFYCC
jgi:hypothetical protein